VNRDFHLFWAGQTTSAFGTTCAAVVLPLIAVRHLDATAHDMSLIAAAGPATMLTCGLFAATYADRLARRRPHLIGCDLAAAVALSAAAVALITGHLTVWGLLLLAVLLGLLGVLTESLYFSHLTSIVGPGALVAARARLQGGEYVASLLGRGIAGPVIMFAGLAVPLLVNVAAYLLNALALAFIRRPEAMARDGAERAAPDEAEGSGRVRRADLTAGFAVLRREPTLRRLTQHLVLDSLATGALSAVTAIFLLNVLRVPDAWFGFLYLLVGVAGATGTGLSALLARRVDAARLAALGALGGAAVTAVLPLASGPLPLAATLAALGIGLPVLFEAVSNVGITAYVTAALPERVLGRTGASIGMLVSVAHVAGALAGGVAADRIGVRPTLWAAVAVSVLAGSTVLPLVRQRDRHRRHQPRRLRRTARLVDTGTPA
jgi:hypothetical protein